MLSALLAPLRTARVPPFYADRLEISSKFLSGLSVESYSGGEQLFGYLEWKGTSGNLLSSLTCASNIMPGKQLLFFFFFLLCKLSAAER